MHKAGFFDPRSWVSGLAFTKNDGLLGDLGQYFNFDKRNKVLTIDGDRITLTDEQIRQLHAMLVMVKDLKQSEVYREQYEYEVRIQQETKTVSTTPLVIPSKDGKRTYIIDVQYKDTGFFDEYPGYYFVLGISENSTMSKEIEDALKNTNPQDEIKKLIKEKKIAFKNPFVSAEYHADESKDPHNKGGFTLRVRTAGRADFVEYVNVELSETDIDGIVNLIQGYNTNKSATYTKSDYVYQLIEYFKKHPYRISFHFDGTRIYMMPVYNRNQEPASNSGGVSIGPVPTTTLPF